MGSNPTLSAKSHPRLSVVFFLKDGGFRPPNLPRQHASYPGEDGGGSGLKFQLVSILCRSELGGLAIIGCSPVPLLPPVEPNQAKMLLPIWVRTELAPRWPRR